MNETIITYVENCRETLKERPFNEVDSLVLSQISYLKMKGIVPGLEKERDFVPFSYIMEEQFHKKVFQDKRFRKDNEALASALLKSRRYKDLELNYHVDLVDKIMEVQFSAVTFRMGDLYYVAYRGTDESLVGWKEDFFLAVSEPGIGQLYGVKYLKRVAEKIPGDFIIGGHSKGGNLAIFAGLTAVSATKKRIKTIYNHDGPGIKREIKERNNYGQIAHKIQKTVPKASLIGLLMEQDRNYKIVDNNTYGLAQHNPFTWLVEDGEFLLSDRLTGNAFFLETAVNEWLLTLDDEQIRVLIEVLFHVLQACEHDNLIDMMDDWKKTIQGIYTGLRTVDEQTWENGSALWKSFLESAQRSTKANIPVWIRQLQSTGKKEDKQKKSQIRLTKKSRKEA